ncbi:MAG: hypothetical protein OXE52_07780 [Chloroflexi bacterium]|nr:hypothetical protein [Chloroflexota bacterium]
MGEWTQTIATIISVLGLGIALLAYLTRQFNRIGDRFDKLDERVQNVENHQARLDERLTQVETRLDERLTQVESRLDRLEERVGQGLQNVHEGLQNVEIEQARMLGFLEGRGVMGKAPADVEGAA